MKYSALLTDEAKASAQGIYDWIAERSVSGADHWFDALSNALTEIELQPDGYPRASEEFLAAAGVHEHYFKTRYGKVYRLLFKIVGSEVHIIYVRGPGQSLLS